jgi:hypothetical protein
MEIPKRSSCFSTKNNVEKEKNIPDIFGQGIVILKIQRLYY